ncbi:MAG: flagellar biosynthesis protein FlgJ [Ruminiclostridium sp.]|nr:flagellar biosynthesis protein FlgJ [Ruminiclostridium sp.]
MEINNIKRALNIMTQDTVEAPLKQAGDKSFEDELKAAMDKSDDKELKNVCKQFEGIMLNILYKQMKATINRSDLIEPDPGREIFESMLDESMMEKASQSSTLGLADSLYKQLRRQSASSAEKEREKAAEGVGPVEK